MQVVAYSLVRAADKSIKETETSRTYPYTELFYLKRI